MDTSSQSGLAKAIAKYPTLKAFSDALDVKYQVVQQWLINGVPAEYCPTIEKLTGVRCEDLNDRVDWAYVRSNKLRKHRA
jgi:DNA-binding transcriptional regulator YdaS (Cro superfamily)